ncbi:hypothetical protein PC121_g10338 [Phytophthora cactorum]|nr:hypothetical protein PC120_g24110 [Phytophthora cactorum]KAG3067985.1 hypothetical protein PC121_g10338 [Phytophthora cactorum]KAG4050533.1 hypothetical protein PC123_g14228 [Phytophthora cactorum]
MSDSPDVTTHTRMSTGRNVVQQALISASGGVRRPEYKNYHDIECPGG